MIARRRLWPVLVALVVCLLVVSSGACTGSPSTPGPSGGETGVGEATPTGGDGGAAACTNAHLPVAEGNTWTYELSEPAGTVYTDTITAVEGDSFTITTAFDELTKQTEWACDDDGLVALTYGSGPAASLTVGGLEGELRTKDVTGVTLPAELSPGDRWRQTFELAGSFAAAGVETKVTGTIEYVLRARDVEAVEVPAGTFEAIAVDTDITLDLTPSSGGVSIPLTLELDGVQWFAEGVGLVRSESEGDFFGASFSSTAELTSYSVA